MPLDDREFAYNRVVSKAHGHLTHIYFNWRGTLLGFFLHIPLKGQFHSQGTNAELKYIALSEEELRPRQSWDKVV